MRKWLLILTAALAPLGCGPGRAARDLADGAAGDKKAAAKEGTSVQGSAWTWGYFFTGDAPAVEALAGAREHSLTRYRVERVAAVRGEPGVSLDKGATLVRLEVAARLPVAEEAGPRL